MAEHLAAGRYWNAMTPLQSAPRRLRRAEPPVVAGVAGGIGAYLGVPARLVRLVFAVLTFIDGIGVTLYLAAWLLVPRDDGIDQRPFTLTSSTPSLVAGFVLLGFAALGAVGDFWPLAEPEIVIPILLVGAGFALLNRRAGDPAIGEHAFGSTRSQVTWPPSPPATVPPRTPQPDPPPDSWTADPAAVFSRGGPAPPVHPSEAHGSPTTAAGSPPIDESSPRHETGDPDLGSTPVERAAGEAAPESPAAGEAAPESPAAGEAAPESPAAGDPLLEEAARLLEAADRAGDPTAGIDGAGRALSEASALAPLRAPVSPGGPPPWDTSPDRAAPWAVAHPESSTRPTARRGPPVTSITLAVAAVDVGLFLVLANVAQLGISATTLLGSLLAVFGGGLVASAIYERALPLYPLAAITLLLLTAAPLIDTTMSGGVGTREVRVASLDGLEPAYSLGLGELNIDLRELDPTENTTVVADVGAGSLTIDVPNDVRVEIVATSRAGYVDVLGDADEGVRNRLFRVAGGDDREDPTLRIEASVTFGYVEVNRRGP